MPEVINTATVGDIWYRYIDRRYSVVLDSERETYRFQSVVECEQWAVARVTPKGAWLCRTWDLWRSFDELRILGFVRFARIDTRRKFAAPSVKAALESYLARKIKQQNILFSRANEAESLVHKAEVLLKEYNEQEQATAQMKSESKELAPC